MAFKIAIILTGGYGLSGLLFVLSTYLTSIGRPEAGQFFTAGVVFAVLTTLILALRLFR